MFMIGRDPSSVALRSLMLKHAWGIVRHPSRKNISKLSKAITMNRIIKQLIEGLSIPSRENLIRLFEMAERIANSDLQRDVIRRIKKAFENGEPATELALRVLTKVNPNCRKHIAESFFINSFLLGEPKRQRFREETGIQPPFLIVISPTMRCNLSCIGCYAGQYTKQEELDFETIDRIITEAKDMGIYFVTVTGGEPFVRKDLLDIYEKHNDVAFQIYTNGTLIDREMARRLADLGNVYPAISVEGFEEETDKRRGKGVYAKVMDAMDNLNREGVIYGFSATITKLNAELLASDEFMDHMVEKGCYFGWYFIYVPIGRGPDIELMATPEQRDMVRERLKHFRATKPIFIGDFWNDGPWVGGCIAGGRKYLHINAKGDVEPCVFCHFAVEKIYGKSLKEVLLSPFFKAIRERQKEFYENLLMPCMLIDRPWVLKEIVEDVGAYPTHEGAESLIKELHEPLCEYSRRYSELSKVAWEREYKYKVRKEMLG
jgi:MoaA/NifB/PqqE/SkfB family radical SAM enzyme